MSMNEFRRLAAKIDQHMQQLAAQGVSEARAVQSNTAGPWGSLLNPSKFFAAPPVCQNSVGADNTRP
jgi:hypothetical protein